MKIVYFKKEENGYILTRVQPSDETYRFIAYWTPKKYMYPSIIVTKKVEGVYRKIPFTTLAEAYVNRGISVKDFIAKQDTLRKDIKALIQQYLAEADDAKMVIHEDDDCNTLTQGTSKETVYPRKWPAWLTYLTKEVKPKYVRDHEACKKEGKVVHKRDKDGNKILVCKAYNSAKNKELINKWKPHCETCPQRPSCTVPCNLGPLADTINLLVEKAKESPANASMKKWADSNEKKIRRIWVKTRTDAHSVKNIAKAALKDMKGVIND